MTWMTSHGSAEIKGNYITSNGSSSSSSNNKSYIFIVSTYQMCILMLFNNTSITELSLSHIMSHVNITNGSDDENEFKRHLESLCTPKIRILIKKSKGKGISNNDIFTWNNEYTSKVKRVKVPLISIKYDDNNGNGIGKDGSGSSSSGNSNVPLAVEKDRIALIEASIVRVMKTRKTLSHNDLIIEVIRQLQDRFNPSPAFIKKRIEALIERDYLERDSDNRQVYIYI